MHPALIPLMFPVLRKLDQHQALHILVGDIAGSDVHEIVRRAAVGFRESWGSYLTTKTDEGIRKRPSAITQMWCTGTRMSLVSAAGPGRFPIGPFLAAARWPLARPGRLISPYLKRVLNKEHLILGILISVIFFRIPFASPTCAAEAPRARGSELLRVVNRRAKSEPATRNRRTTWRSCSTLRRRCCRARAPHSPVARGAG